MIIIIPWIPLLNVGTSVYAKASFEFRKSFALKMQLTIVNLPFFVGNTVCFACCIYFIVYFIFK